MRKIALLTIPLLVLGLFSLSAEMMLDPTGVTVEVSGEATLTWGIDLETNATGFTSTSKSDLKVTIVPKQSTDTGMMDSDDLYAYIELKDFKWEVTSADGQGKTTAPGVTAKLIMGAFSIKTFSSPDLAIDYVDSQDKDKADGTDEDEFPGVDFADVETDYPGYGLEVSYDVDPVVLSLGVVSEHDWTDDPAKSKEKVDCHMHGNDPATTKVVEDDTHTYIPKGACKEAETDDINDENAYAFIGTVNLDIGDNADLVAKVSYAHEYQHDGGIVTPKSTTHDEIGIGAKANFNLGDITTHVAFDTAVPAGGKTIPWDVGGGVKWNLSEDETSYVSTDMMMYSPGGGEKLYLALSLVEGEGDEGALEGMGAKLSVGLDDAAGAGNWNAKIGASYKVNDIKPYFDVGFGTGAAKTPFKAGLELTMIEHLTAKVEYSSKDVGGTDKGDVTTSLKISY